MTQFYSKKFLGNLFQHLTKSFSIATVSAIGKGLPMVLLLLMTGVQSQAQQYTTPLGTSSNVFPLGNTATNKVQWLYMASDFTPAYPATPQLISKLYIKVGSSPTTATTVTFTNFTVSLGTNPITAMATGPWLTGLTSMINATSYTTSTPIVYNGWFQIQLPTPYLWNPSAGNLIMEVTQTAYTPTAVYMLQYSSNGSRRAWGAVGSTNSTGSGTGQVQLGIDVLPACADVAAASVAVSNVGTDVATVSWASPTTGSVGSEYVVDQTATSPTVAGTSTTLNYVNLSGLTPNTNYYFHVRNVCTSGTSYNWTNVPFATLPCTLSQPTTTVNGNTSFCNGAITQLSIPQVPGATYHWYNSGNLILGAVGSTYTAFTSGQYHAEMIKGGCPIGSDTTTVTVYPAPTYSYTASSLDICDGSTSLLSVNTTNSYGYQWQKNGTNIPGATGTTYNVSSTGDYRVLVTTPNCTDTSLIRTITWHPMPIPVISAALAPTLTTQAGYQSYQWFRYGMPIPNTNSNSYTTTQNGLYTVSIVDEWGCKSLSQGVQVGPTGINNLNPIAQQISAFPNPTNGLLHIKTPADITATLQSMDGKILFSAKNAHAMDLTNLAEGVYFLRFTDQDNNLVKLEKVIKASR